MSWRAYFFSGAMLAAVVAGFAVPARTQGLDDAIAYEAWRAIHRAESQNHIPRGLLHAMSLVETGQGMDGHYMPWPYTLNVNSSSKKTFPSHSAAKAEIDRLAAAGFTRFDVWTGEMRHGNLSQQGAKSKLEGVVGLVAVRGRGFAKRYDSAAHASRALHALLNGGFKNVDVGLMQVNWYWHGTKFASVEDALNPQKNLAYAVSYLREHKKERDWWGSVGRYHSGTPKYANKYVMNVWDMYQKVHRIKPKDSGA